MSQLRVDEITNETGDGPPDFPFGAGGVSPTIASTAQAETGTDNETFITPLRMREGFNAAGSAPVFACRAFVNLTASGAIINDSGGVSSITDLGTGRTRINFLNSMPNNNYTVVCATRYDSLTSPARQHDYIANQLTTSYEVQTVNVGGGAAYTNANTSSAVFSKD